MIRSLTVVLMVFATVTSSKAGSQTEGAAVETVRKEFGPPAMLVARPAEAPVIDGRLDDKAWTAAKPVTLGFVFDGWNSPSQRTEARVLADERAIYFAVRCWETRPEQMRVVGRGDLSRTNLGDTVEFFLDPLHDGTLRYYKPGSMTPGRVHTYYHVIVGPDGAEFHRGGPDYGKWKADITAKSGRFDGGWTVEAAVPIKDLRLTKDTVPDVWGLNICRQRPERGVVRPKAAVGPARFRPSIRPLDEPGKYRDGEFSAWAPTWDDYSYANSMPFHHPNYFGHALLEVGATKTPQPTKVFEVLYRSDFDSGAVGPWNVWRNSGDEDAVLADESFRGPGRSVTAKEGGKYAIRMTTPLKGLEGVTLIMAFRMTENGRLYYYGRAPDNKQCGAHRHEVFMTREAAAERAATKSGGYSLFPRLPLYHTHADFAAWKPLGRRWRAPGNWALMSGYFSEPTIGSVMSPGTDWVILRTRLGLFRRFHGPDKGQSLVPRTQDYPGGLTFAPSGGGRLFISDLVIFRGFDVEPPARVTGVTLTRDARKLRLNWHRAPDNTLTAFYRILANGTPVAETHRLFAEIDLKAANGTSLTIIAHDLYANASAPSAPAD